MILTIMILICATIALMIWNLVAEIRMQHRLESGLRTINKRVKRLEASNELVYTLDNTTAPETVSDVAEEHDNAPDTPTDGDV